MKSSTFTRLALTGLLLALLTALTGCQTTAPSKPAHGQAEAIPGSGMPDFPDASC